MMADYVENLNAENAKLAAWIDELRADQERMREALATYGFHGFYCAAWARAPWREEDRALCDCGLAAALSSTPTPETAP